MRHTELRSGFDHVPRTVAVLSRDFPPHQTTGPHHHRRAQLLHASSGVMRLATDQGHWLVPQGHAVWIPPELHHDVAMHGVVAMRTVYVDTAVAAAMPASCRVIAATPLLRACILALAEEPALFDEAGRGGHLAALILDEIGRATAAPTALPLPADPRLAVLTQALIADPSLTLGLDAWADRIAMSRRSLTRRFRAQTGLSFLAWRQRLRAMTAMALLAEGVPPARVAHRVGYRDPRSLRRLGIRAGH